MVTELTPRIRLFQEDCLTGLIRTPDKYYHLAITDPPYFPALSKLGYFYQERSSTGVKMGYEKIGSWEVPGQEYLDELLRVSEDQIIWGINYYPFYHGPGRIVWDKCNQSSSFSDCEIASCSLHDSARLFRYMWNGMLQGKSITEGHVMQGNKKLNERRIHPTQKPVLLYKWLLSQYAKPGQRILDTHGGSLSLAIACHDLGYELDVWEKDPIICQLAIERFRQHASQTSLFQI